MQPQPQSPFPSTNPLRSIAMVVLGTMLGFMIPLPMTANSAPALSISSSLIGAILGGFIGFKRRQSVGFFYFTLIATLLLISIFSTNLFTYQN